VRELAEVLAVDFDDGEGIPKLNAEWRWEDHEQALLSSCSSLIAIVDGHRWYDDEDNDDDDDDKEDDDDDDDEDEDEEGDDDDDDDDWLYDDDDDSNFWLYDNEDEDNDCYEDDENGGENNNDYEDTRVVQFSHFSVREFLTSPRLATSSEDVSRYYIDLERAHTILVQACVGVLLMLDDRVDEDDVLDSFPLAGYAAKHWVRHAQFGNASSSSYLRKATEYLFDPDKPYFKAWLRLHDMDRVHHWRSAFYIFLPFEKSPTTPLYYAALCGFHDLTKTLIVKHPQHVNADGGHYMRPLIAALVGEHFQVAELLHHNGASPNVRGSKMRTPLHSAAYYGHFKVVQKLIEYGADTDAQDADGCTPVSLASAGVDLRDPNVIRLLLECGVDVSARAADRSTPLHTASHWGAVKVARILLEHGADILAEDDKGRTPLRVAEEKKHNKLIKLLSEYGAK
jgi:hypothetical protein